ncbi:MAG: hypothetical protein QOI91_1126 [Solirubrobacteraceae bacterium]|jgi:hypothetical protein|nr:hypothetical protein [Solirubrobacteraceae bacterium]
MAEFRVVIDEVELSEEQHKAINASIQRAVLPHLADLGLNADRPVIAIPDKRHWRGIWIGPIDRGVLEQQIPQLDKYFGR